MRMNKEITLGSKFVFVADSSPDYDGAIYRDTVTVYAQGYTQALEILTQYGYSNPSQELRS